MFKKILNIFNSKKILTVNEYNKVSALPKYKENFLHIYIKNNIDELLNRSLNNFYNMNIKPKIGIEVEFYFKNDNFNEGEFYNDIYNFCSINSINIIDIEHERGKNQFEIRFKPYMNIIKLIDDFNSLKLYIFNNYQTTFETIYFYDRPMSALQTNISLEDKNDNNLFARIDLNGTKVESNFLNYSVAGILNNINLFLKLYNDDNLNRFDYKINQILDQKGFVAAPIFISWGVNNRSTAVRIPVPKDIINLKEYETKDNLERRIEFRLPSSNSNLKYIIFCNLISIYYGITEKMQPILKTSSNVLQTYQELNVIQHENFSFLNEKNLDFFFKYISLQ